MTDKEKILLGECVSPLTVERCSFCIDSCEAFKYFSKVQSELNKNGIKRQL